MIISPEIAAPDPTKIGENLKRARLCLGKTVDEFAREAGIPYKTYAGWEIGAQRCSLNGAFKIRSAHGIDLEYIYFGNVDALPHRMAKALTSSP